MDIMLQPVGIRGLWKPYQKEQRSKELKLLGVTVPTLFSDKASKGFERTPNSYVNNEIKAESLSNRIHYLLNESKAFIVLPGKIGTLTELFVAWNSNYLYNINKEYDLIPIYLKKDFWKEIIDNLPENMELDKQFINYFESIEDLEEIISKLN